MTGAGGGIGPRERWWLVLFLALGSAYFAFLVIERSLALLGGFGTILLILFLAWLLAFVMSALVAGIAERVDLPRPTIVVGAYLLALVVFGFAVFYTGAAMTQQVAELARNYPAAERDILAVLADWERGLQFGRLRLDLTDLYGGALAGLAQIGSDVVEQAQNIAGVTIAALGALLLIIVISLYMVMDSQRILGRLRSVVPRRYRDEADLLERSIVRAFGGFLRAQLILAVLQAVTVGVVGSIFGVPYLFLWGTLSALAMLIPFFGPPLALIPPVIGAALFAGESLIPLAIILFAVQTVIVNWLQPRLLRGALGLHPILVLVGLLVGAQVAGVWGALFGIPVIAVLWVFVSYAVFRTVPNAALSERERLSDVDEHVMVRVEKEQVGDETHPHIHVTRTRRPDGSEQVELRMEEPDRGEGPAPSGAEGWATPEYSLLASEWRDLFGEVAGAHVAAADIAQRRLLDLADLLRHRAARMESATRGRVGRRGQIALEHDPLAAHGRVRHRNGRQEGLGVRMGRRLVQLVGIRQLNQLSEVHDPDPRRKVLDDRQVVGNEQVGELELVLEVAQQVEHLRLNRHVERTDRLIAHDEARSQGQGARDSDALALAAGELVRVAVNVLLIETHPLQEVPDRRLALALVRHAVDVQALTHDLAHAHARVEAGIRILEHDLDVAPRRLELA